MSTQRLPPQWSSTWIITRKVVPLKLLDGEDKFTLGQVMLTYRDNRDITQHYTGLSKKMDGI